MLMAAMRNNAALEMNDEAYAYRMRDSIRDSVASIKDDPFFRNYQTPQSVSLARELRSASHNSNGGNYELDGTQSAADSNLSNTTVWSYLLSIKFQK